MRGRKRLPSRLMPAAGRVLRALHVARVLWRRLRRPITLGCRALIVDRDRRVLLVRHSYVGGWHLPGGGVGPGETLREAALREMREEVGVEAAGPVRLHGLFLRTTHGHSDHVGVYVVEHWRGRPVGDGVEVVTARFFPPDALPPDVSPATRRRIEEWHGGHEPDEHW